MTFLLLNNFVSEDCQLSCVWLRPSINKARGELVPIKYCVHSSTTAIYRETLVSLTSIAVATCIWVVVYLTVPSVPQTGHSIPQWPPNNELHRSRTKQSWCNRENILVFEATEKNHDKLIVVHVSTDKQTGHFRSTKCTKKNGEVWTAII